MARITKRLVRIEKRFYLTFREQLVWVMSTGVAIAVAIVWKDTFTLIMNQYLKAQTSIQSSFYGAVIFTLIGVLVIWIVNEIFKRR